MLGDMLHIDTEKNIALILKMGQFENSIDIIYLGKFRKIYTD